MKFPKGTDSFSCYSRHMDRHRYITTLIKWPPHYSTNISNKSSVPSPYPALALDRWMEQNPPFTPPKCTPFTQHLDQYKYLPNVNADKTLPYKTLEFLCKLSLKYNRLGSSSHMVTATVFLSFMHQVTACHHMQVITKE